ncbi:general stress protein [Jeotgalicoccus sp. S0W5]|uniref:general stress protein n=1 Tax=Jeotgalicoccus sp. S0W5 TaxID=2527874 RepID=UPI0014152C21|nr:general stress protein [Jeotgalicoccus sp. S0W5]
MTTIEKFSNIDDLSDKIYELRADGVKDKDMITVAKDRFKATVLRYTNVGFKKADGNMWDKVAAKFLDENSTDRVFDQLDLSSDELNTFKAAVDNGQILLLVRESAVKETKKEKAATSRQNEDHLRKAEEKKEAGEQNQSARETEKNQKESSDQRSGTIDVSAYQSKLDSMTSEKDIKRNNQKAEAKEKHDNFMDAAEIIQEDGSRRTVSISDTEHTVIDLNQK